MALEIRRKFKRIFFVRAGLLAVLVILSIVFSTLTLEQFLIKSALRSEAEYFWDRFEKNPTINAPNTWNLKGYFVDKDNFAALSKDEVAEIEEYAFNAFLLEENKRKLQQTRLKVNQLSTEQQVALIPIGFTRLESQPGYSLLYKTENHSQTLLLVFDGENVRSLAIFLGLIPLIFFLCISYLLVWLFYRKAKEMLSPITWLASKFTDFDPVSPNLPKIELAEIPEDADYEATVLAESLSEYVKRIEKFIARERAFTRDVSHELRTPLTVIRMATQVIEANDQLKAQDKKTLTRIKNASKDMLELVEVFLILARESDSHIQEECIDMHDVIDHELNQSKSALGNKNIEVIVNTNSPLKINTSAKILEVLVGNLIRNAFKYTEKGSVTINVNQRTLSITDTGVGMTENQVEQVFKPYFRAGTRPEGGHGVGLTIVKRISDRFNWPVEIESEIDKGTTVTVDFSSAI